MPSPVPSFRFSTPLSQTSSTLNPPSLAARVGTGPRPQSSSSSLSELGPATFEDLIRHMNTRFDELAAQLANLPVIQSQVDANTVRLNELEEQNKALAADVATLRATIRANSSECTNSGSTSREAEVIISGAPCSSPEDLPLVVLQVAAALGVPLSNGDVVASRFLVTRDKARKNTPLPIVDKLRTEVLARLLSAKKSKGRLMSNELLPPPAGPVSAININEALPPDVYRLLIDAKAMAKSNGYRFVWQRGGVVHVRRAQGSWVKTVRTADDLARLASA